MNSLPPIEEKNNIDFPVTIGVFGMLSAFCFGQDLSIEQGYKLLSAAHNGHNFISLDSERRPIGFIVWTKLPKSSLDATKSSGYSSVEERIALLDVSHDDGDPTIIYMLSPFGKHLDVINSWQTTLGFIDSTCWVLPDKGYPNILKL